MYAHMAITGFKKEGQMDNSNDKGTHIGCARQNGHRYCVCLGVKALILCVLMGNGTHSLCAQG